RLPRAPQSVRNRSASKRPASLVGAPHTARGRRVSGHVRHVNYACLGRIALQCRRLWLRQGRHASVAVRKFAQFLSLLRSELPNQSDTSNFTILVSLWTRSSQ